MLEQENDRNPPIDTHQAKSGLSTRVVQALGDWETIAMVERYSKSLTFDDALQLYKQVNGSGVCGQLDVSSVNNAE
jgi:hypothetical protein